MGSSWNNQTKLQGDVAHAQQKVPDHSDWAMGQFEKLAHSLLDPLVLGFANVWKRGSIPIAGNLIDHCALGAFPAE